MIYFLPDVKEYRVFWTLKQYSTGKHSDVWFYFCSRSKVWNYDSEFV